MRAVPALFACQTFRRLPSFRLHHPLLARGSTTKLTIRPSLLERNMSTATSIVEVSAAWLAAEKAKPSTAMLHVDVRRIDELQADGRCG